MSPSNNVFFLGGHDAEMCEIKEILTKHDCTYFDKKLSWGAKASDYKDEINNLKENEIPVLIELIIDIQLPEDTVIIDHHNEKQSNKSSIEQIAERLNINLNRWQQLIAANDKGYIPAMECLCATKDEINQIREADRKAQGVTEEDEKLAVESIEKHISEENGITVIKSLTDKFSPITDRMYGKTNRLLTYTNEELSYYGIGKNLLKEKYLSYVKEKKAFHGGGDSGFFGFSKGSFSEKEIEIFKEEIININLQEDIPISHHIFLFPFKWDLKSENKPLEEILFKNRTNLKHISKIITGNTNIEGIKWSDFEFKIKQPRDYNEFTYFYEYVTAALFDCGKENKETDWDNKVILQYNLKLERNESKYLINVVEREPWGKPKVPSITYELLIEDIIINFYQTGVGILSFHLSNYQHNEPEQILDINDFGRRIYPQYLNDNDQSSPLKTVKETFLANSVELELKVPGQKNVVKVKDCFHKYCNWFEGSDPQTISKLPNFITKLLGKNFKDTERDLAIGDVKLTPVIDDRMFTLCWYGNEHCANILSEKQWSKELNRFEYNYENNDLWYRFIFVDNRSSGVANSNFLRDLNLKHTYNRWIEYGTFFGISSYSFIMLTNRVDFAKYLLLPHLQTTYFQLVMLALIQRASLLRFSDEATKVKLLKKTKQEQSIDSQLDYVKQLYERYLHFVNKIFFREPTAQEQGIELYDMLLDKMRTEREVKNLDNELEELHRYASLIAQKKQNEEIKRGNEEVRLLTKLATLILPATLIAGILGMNTLPGTSSLPDKIFNGVFYAGFWMSVGIVLFISYIIIIVAERLLKFELIEKRKNRILFHVIIWILSIISIIVIPLVT